MKSVNAVRSECLGGSNCVVFFADTTATPEFIQIIFSGKLAAIPSLKNSKIPGRNFISNITQGKLLAMTEMYSYVTRMRKVDYGPAQIFVQVIIGSKSRIDEDNGFASIKDWLESPAGKNRDWGIGITENDKHVTGYAINAKLIGLETENTIISIRPYTDTIRDHVRHSADFLGRLQLIDPMFLKPHPLPVVQK